jgi:osmotically-inducible protein OsmY
VSKENEMPDNQLELAVMAALADNRHVNADEIAVQAIGDDVTLHGTVPNLVQHAEAMRTAHQVPGVGRVEDRLHVRPQGYLDRVDADTEAAVIAALIADGVPAAGIDVEAEGDRVTLTGLVDLEAQRDRAERVALTVGGVAHVRNKVRALLPASADAPPTQHTKEGRMAFSEQMAKLAARAKLAEERAVAAGEKARGDLERDVAAARASAKAQPHIAAIRAKIEEKKADHDRAQAQRDAHEAEYDALYAIDYAYGAIEEAERLVLDAELARITADELEAGQRATA